MRTKMEKRAIIKQTALDDMESKTDKYINRKKEKKGEKDREMTKVQYIRKSQSWLKDGNMAEGMNRKKANRIGKRINRLDIKRNNFKENK